MIYVISGICAALAYSTDSIFGKIALEGLPLNIYFIIVAFVYSIVGVVLAIIHRNDIYKYLKKENANNYYYLKYAILAVIIGTILGDYLMFYTINKSSEVNLPIAISLIHLAPIFSLFLVYFWFKKQMNIKAIFGICLVFIGTLIALYYSNNN
jgi:drug/metabolite transporter (DMT)-like permease